MRTTLTLIALATSLSLNFGAYAADTSVPGATNSTPGAESKGNPITPPDNGTAGAERVRPAEERLLEEPSVPQAPRAKAIRFRRPNNPHLWLISELVRFILAVKS